MVSNLRLKYCPGEYLRKRIRSLNRRNSHRPPFCEHLCGAVANSSRSPEACKQRSHMRFTTVRWSQIILSLSRYPGAGASTPGPKLTIAGCHGDRFSPTGTETSANRRRSLHSSFDRTSSMVRAMYGANWGKGEAAKSMSFKVICVAGGPVRNEDGRSILLEMYSTFLAENITAKADGAL